MTEEKQKEEAPKEIPKVLLEALRQIVREENQKLMPQNTTQTSKNTLPTSEPQSDLLKHWKAEEITNASDDCPECKAERDKLKEAFGKPYLEAHWREKLPNVCANENCGEGVLVDEESCPKCHGTKAKKRA